MIDSSTGEANTHMYWTGFTLITCKNSLAGPIVNTQSVVVLVWIILGVSIKPGLCYDIPESLYGRTGIPYREHRTAVYRYIGISLQPYMLVATVHLSISVSGNSYLLIPKYSKSHYFCSGSSKGGWVEILARPLGPKDIDTGCLVCLPGGKAYRLPTDHLITG